MFANFWHVENKFNYKKTALKYSYVFIELGNKIALLFS